MAKQTEKEQVDILDEASELEVYSLGSLERLNKENEIKNHWFKEKAIVWLSILVIIVILTASVGVLALSEDGDTRDWARQTVSALLGFAAGAIWQTKK